MGMKEQIESLTKKNAELEAKVAKSGGERIAELEDALVKSEKRAVDAEDALAQAETMSREAVAKAEKEAGAVIAELESKVNNAEGEMDRAIKALIAEEEEHKNSLAKVADLQEKMAMMAMGQIGSDSSLVAPKGAILAVRALSKDGFCRSGQRWPNNWSYVKPGDLTPAQLTAVIDEPRLETRKLA
jgi:hypothetical protein